MSHHELKDALREMRWVEETERFGLVGFEGPPSVEDLELAGAEPTSQLVRESGATTLLLPERCLEQLIERHPEAEIERGLYWIRFEAPMAWDLVGFLAHVSAALAEAGVPIGVVCSFHRDHLFVGAGSVEDARRVLTELFGPPAH